MSKKKEAEKVEEQNKKAAQSAPKKKEVEKVEDQNKKPGLSATKKKEVEKIETLNNKAGHSGSKKKEAVNQKGQKGILEKAKEPVAPPTKKVVKVVADGAEIVEEHIIQPVIPEVKKPKKPRFVREKKPEKQAQAEIAPLARSSKITSKLMSKGLVMPPKEEISTNQKPKV